MKTRNHRTLVLGLLALLAALPLRDAAVDTCCTAVLSGFDLKDASVSRSLAAGVQQPVAGDEVFFNGSAVSGPTAPSSIVFLLDNSGSMTDFPQVATTSALPSVTAPTAPTNTATAFTVAGSCSYSGNNTYKWLNAVTPASATTYADPGFDYGGSYPRDVPPWTPPNCSGDNCLFDPASTYEYGDWTETTAHRLADPCTAYDGNGNPIIDYYNKTVKAGSACTDCLASSGFYMFNASYVTGIRNGNVRTTSTGTYRRFKGTYLNANPPKFVSARNAIKQAIQIDPSDKKLRDKVRYGLTTFWNTTSTGTAVDNGNNGSGTAGTYQTGDGATLIVPLGPDCVTTATSGFTQNRQAIIDAINRTSNPIRFQNYTPLAESLFNIGQYFSAPGATGVFEKRFGTTFEKASTTWSGQDFRETSPGAIDASWTKSGTNPNPDQKSICWSCQISSAIIVTDGMPNNESGLPYTTSGVAPASHTTNPFTVNGADKWDFQSWRPTAYTSQCGGYRGSSADKCQSYLPLVAYYLYENDMRDAGSMIGTQNVITHTISFGVTDATALATLQATANLGGGKFSNTQDREALLDAITRAVNNVVQRSTSFSAANANALQTNRNQATETFFARFKPSSSRAWEGRLIQAILFDEFAMGCDVTKKKANETSADLVACGNTTHSPNFDGDTDPDGFNRCSGVFLVDLDCDEITEDGSGNFVKLKNLLAANLPWDAGVALSHPELSTASTTYRSAAETATTGGSQIRKIKTWVGAAGGLVDFKTTDATTLQALEKAMALDQPFCQTLLTDTAACSGTGCHTASNWTQADTDLCAKLVIQYVRGYDVMDQDGDGCRGPLNSASTCAGGEERDWKSADTTKQWKLGDIFHSTPAVVKPPVDILRCDLGYDPQCVATLHSPAGLPNQTQTDPNAYETWRVAHRDRERVVLAGANDGMLHAFNGGAPDTTKAQDPLTGSYPYTQGSAAEEWAFIPPDLLPRLKFLLYGHQYMVDGSTMVRDIWVDGGADGTGTKDGIKQSNEFHTIAILSERSGGTQFVALEVTDPLNPRYLWSFPRPCSDDARWMAESWSDFAPRPPPIGPVKIKSSAARGFDERWIAMLNGGYDPALVKGRAVFMVDAWTGNTVWRFTDDDVKTLKGNGSPVHMFPVPAAVGLVDLGDTSKSVFDSDGFFDTATWGDMGGNLWVARFQIPGDVDTNTGRVKNWFAARAFEQQRRTDDKMMLRADGSTTTPLGQVRSPFFYMTSNAYEGTSHTLRTFVGTGNREQMMQNGAACGPDNVLSCAQSGCSKVETRTTDDYGNSCVDDAHLVFQNGEFTFTSSSGCAPSALVCAAATRNTYVSTTRFDFTCGATTSTLTGSTTCNASGVCSSYSEIGSGRDVSAGLTASGLHDRFYGIWSYGGKSVKQFDDVDDAKALLAAQAFDTHRFTDVAYTATPCGAGTDGAACRLVDTTWAQVNYDPDSAAIVLATTCPTGHTPCEAKVTDAGWFYEYGQTCPNKSCSPSPPWTDEKTASAGNLVLGCAAWSGFRPVSTNGVVSTSGDVCTATAAATSSNSYLSHFVSGVPTRACGYALDGTVYRSEQRNTWSPPSAATVRVTVNAAGQVSYSTLQLDPGAPPTHKTVGVRSDVVEPVYLLEVSRDAHACRHEDATKCP